MKFDSAKFRRHPKITKRDLRIVSFRISSFIIESNVTNNSRWIIVGRGKGLPLCFHIQRTRNKRPGSMIFFYLLPETITFFSWTSEASRSGDS